MIHLRERPSETSRAVRANHTLSTGPSHTALNVTPERYGVFEQTFVNMGQDDMAERDREIGRRAHALVAGFCREGIHPEPTQVWVATAKLFKAAPVSLNHGARQRAACAVSSYFLRFHRPTWQFVGAELALGAGRIDLVWRAAEAGYVIDELKTGSLCEVVDDPRTIEQVARYNQAATERWGPDFAGVRLLPLTSPGRATFCAPDAVRIALADAPVEVR